jgi:hypothetical protein
MKRTGTGRVLSTLFIGIMFGIYRHVDQLKWLQRGRDAYLAGQSQRFDRFAHYHSGPTMMMAGIILAAVAVGLYEVIAAGFTRVLPPSTVEE